VGLRHKPVLVEFISNYDRAVFKIYQGEEINSSNLRFVLGIKNRDEFSDLERELNKSSLVETQREGNLRTYLPGQRKITAYDGSRIGKDNYVMH
jgi:hypothetical protein